MDHFSNTTSGPRPGALNRLREARPFKVQTTVKTPFNGSITGIPGVYPISNLTPSVFAQFGVVIVECRDLERRLQ